MRTNNLRGPCALLAVLAASFGGSVSGEAFQPVAELAYKPSPDFFRDSEHLNAGEASGVAYNSKGSIFLFQRVRPMLAEYDAGGKYVRSIGDALRRHARLHPGSWRESVKAADLALCSLLAT